MILDSFTKKPFIEKNIKFEEGPLHATKEELTTDPPILVDADLTNASSIALDEEEEADGNDEQVDTDSITIQLWAQKSLHATSDLVGDPTNIQRSHSQFQSAPQALTITLLQSLCCASTVTWSLL